MKWHLYLLLILVSFCGIGCKSIENTTYKVKTDTCYIYKYDRDSIYFRDSIYIKDSGDTVWMKEWHTKYVEKINLDTIYLSRNDTSYVERTITLPAEKYIPKWIIWLLVITGTITLLVFIKIGIKIYTKFTTGGLL